MRILSILLLFVSTFSFAQSEFSLKMEYNTVFNATEPYVQHFPHSVSRWTALDGDKFSSDEKRKPLTYRLPLSLSVAKDFKTEKDNIFTLGLRYGRYSRLDTLGSRLRYSDMVNENSGFVNPSSYTLESGYYLYHSLGLDIGYTVEDKVGKTSHRLGAMMGVERIIGSRYFLNHIDSRNGSKSDFSSKDLTVSDKVWLIMPAINYSTNILSRESDKWWLEASFRFNLQETRENGPLGDIASLGLRYYL